MVEKPLNPKELGLLKNMARNSSLSQRSLAKSNGLSLGLINVIIKRFTRDGYIQISRINRRKVAYILTPRGILETARKTSSYINETIRKFRQIEGNLSRMILELYGAGYNYFSIHGNGELKELVESIFRASLVDAPVSLGTEHRKDPRAVILNLMTEPPKDPIEGTIVNVLGRIGEL